MTAAVVIEGRREPRRRALDDVDALARELAAQVGGVEHVAEENAADFAAAAGVDADDLWTAVGRLTAGRD